MHIFIPSKGRPNPRTAKMLDQAGIPYTLFVEPQDEDAYEQQAEVAAGSTGTKRSIVVLEKNDQGVSYARQMVLKHAKQSDIGWFWMLDDDITGLYKYSDSEQKLIKHEPLLVLEEALQEAQATPQLVIAGLDFRQFAWSHKGKSIYNTQVCACVLINAEDGWFLKYPDHLMEDKYICLQAISSGYKTVRYTKWAFATPPMGTGDGGCQSLQDRGSEMKRAVEGLMKRFGPDVIKPVYKKKLGWWDCKINWKAVRG